MQQAYPVARSASSAIVDAGKVTLAISAVVLAAGLSRRMGQHSKLLLSVAGEPMIRQTVKNVLGLHPVETIVVTGHRAEDIKAAVADLPVRPVFNADYAQGQQSSVAAGVRALRAKCDVVMVMLGDQPLVTAAHLRALVEAVGGLGPKSIAVPYHRGQRGNPVLFAARHIPAIAGGELNVGCRKLIKRYPDEVARIECEEDVFTRDCDTREDYDRLNALLSANAGMSG
jgi:molybdenum cofactor cytidylyltransferase